MTSQPAAAVRDGGASASPLRSGIELQEDQPSPHAAPTVIGPRLLTRGPAAGDVELSLSAGDGNLGSASSEHTLEAWKVLIGCLCLTIPTYGLMSAIGLFQTYWQEHQLAAEAPTRIAWIASVFGFLDCLFGVVVGPIFDSFPPHYYLPPTCLLYAAAFLGLGWATTYAQFMGCFVVGGIFASFPSVVAFASVDHWFHRHHALAMGFVTLGAPVGGLFFSVILQALFSKLEWRVAMVLLSCILFGFLLIGNLLVNTRPSKGRASIEAGSAGWRTGWSLLRSRKFLLFTYSVFVFEFVLFAQWGSLPAYAVFVGLGNQFYIQMAYNIGAILARTAPPYLATRWGPFNVTLLMIGFTLAVMFLVWIPFGDHSVAALYAVALLVGFGTGSYTPLAASCISELCNGRGVGKWLGACYSFGSVANLISNPVSQAVLQLRGPRDLVVVLGVMLVSAFGTCLWARWLKQDGKWAWRVRV